MKGFRTLSVASIITILGLLQQAQFIDLIPDKFRGAFVAAIGLTMAILRLLTSTKTFTAQ